MALFPSVFESLMADPFGSSVFDVGLLPSAGTNIVGGGRRGAGDVGAAGGRRILTNIYETEDEFVVSAELPGLSREDLNITVHDDILQLGLTDKCKECALKEINEGVTPEGVKPQNWRRYEHARNFAERRLRLPQTADLSNVSAKMCNGMLCVHIKKVPLETKQRRIEIGSA